MGAQISQV